MVGCARIAFAAAAHPAPHFIASSWFTWFAPPHRRAVLRFAPVSSTYRACGTAFWHAVGLGSFTTFYAHCLPRLHTGSCYLLHRLPCRTCCTARFYWFACRHCSAVPVAVAFVQQRSARYAFCHTHCLLYTAGSAVAAVASLYLARFMLLAVPHAKFVKFLVTRT